MRGNHLYEFGPFRLDPGERRLLRDGEPVALTPKCFDLLVMFVGNSGHLLEKAELLERLWPGQFVEEANLSFNVSSLRKALGEGRDGQHFIETVPKKGFRFVARVVDHAGVDADLAVGKKSPVPPADDREEVGESPTRSAPEAAGSALPIPTASPSRRSQRLRILFAVLGALALGLLAYGLRMSRTAVPAGQPHKTIAVLPFKPLSADSRDESLEMGMADTLITKLGNVSQIVVRPFSAVRKYTDPRQDPVEAGRELRAEAVLDGSIQKAGERVRVSVRLVDVRTGARLWAEQFDADFTDIFGVQDSISERVTKALTLELSGEERARLTKRYTDDPEAYQLYLQGYYLRTRSTEEDVRRSFEYYRRALEKDPNFALAYVGMAQSNLTLLGKARAPASEVIPASVAYMLRALELDPGLAEAHNLLAEIRYQHEYDWPGAETEFRRAVELNPNAALIRLAYGWFLMCAGRFDEARAEMERAQELDPSSILINRARGRLFHFTRQYDRAVEHFRKILEVEPGMGPTHWSLATTYEQKGMYAEAVEEYLTDANTNGFLRPEEIEEARETFRVSGWQAYVQMRATKLEERSRKEYIAPTLLANNYVRLGKRDQAFAALEQAFEARDPALVRLTIEPLYDGLRSDPRYTELVRRIKLTP